MSALDIQIGGDHYKGMSIQPMQYSMANGLDACQHTAIKYITRFRQKGGIQDLEKAKHCIDMLIEFELLNAPAKQQDRADLGDFGQQNVFEPASEIDDDSPRQQRIHQNGELGQAIYAAIHRVNHVGSHK